MNKLHEVGSGVMVRTEGSLLHIVVDLSARKGPSASGKTTVIATTKGNLKAPGFPDVRYSFNAYTKPEAPATEATGS